MKSGAMFPKLVVKNTLTGEESEFALVSRETHIGRDVSRNELVLNHHTVSRRHAILRQSGQSFVLVDLNSGNGTLVNGRRITETPISHNDVIAVGDFLLTYFEDKDTIPVQFDSQALGTTLLVRTPDQIIHRLLPPSTTTASELSQPIAEDSIEMLKKKAETLTHLYELSQVLNSVFSLTEVFKRVSQMLFRLTPSDRFVVVLKDSQTGELSPFVTELRDPHSQRRGEKISISRTVLDRVLCEKVSLLSLDAQADERLAPALSIVLQQVRSVMCAPLLAKNRALGVLYLDCRELVKTFSTDDLDLLNAIAVTTSMAVDNALTHDQLLKEALARAAYGRFMPQHVIDEILTNPGALSLGGKNQIVTILFSDVRGFTSISGSLPPETVVQVLNRYFAEMTPIIFEYHGILDKYMGDGLMALFGVPYESQDGARNAVSAAIVMQRRIVNLNEELEARGLPAIQIGIGINTGRVTVGYIGTEQRTDYTAIGDAVNLSARFEKLAQGQQILIGQSTFDAIGENLPTRAYGEARVKGKSEPVQVYEVVWKETVS
jgi:adenylate cyclase